MKKRPMCLVCLGLALGIWLMRLVGFPLSGEPEKRRLETLVQSEETVLVQGQVQDYEIKDNSKNYLITSCVLKVQENEIPIKKLSLITQQEEIFTIGSVIKTEGILQATETPANPGQFDTSAWYAAKGIFYTMWADEIQAVRMASPGFRENLKQIRDRMADRLSEMLPGSQAGILSAMLIGDKSLLDPETKASYQMGGVLHVLSISGLHLSMLGMGLFRLLQKTGCHRLLSSGLSVAGMAVYTVFTGNGVATQRAFLMFTVMVAAGLIGRTYDSVSALALSAVITLIGQPENLSYSGFLLSYLAVLGAAFVWPLWKKGLCSGIAAEKRQKRKERRKAERRKKRGKKKKRNKKLRDQIGISGKNRHAKRDREIKSGTHQQRDSLDRFRKIRETAGRGEKWLKENVLSCVMITLTTLPLNAYFFYEIPVLSLVPNLVILPTMVWVMGSGILGCCAGLFSVPLGRLLLLPASLLLRLYEMVMQMVQRFPGAVWICGQPAFCQVVLYYILLTILLLCISWTMREEHAERPFAVFWFSGKGSVFRVCFLTAAVCCLLFRWNPPLSITALDVGQGDSLVIRKGWNTAWLVDGGSSDEKNVGNYRILPYLKSQGIGTLDAVLVTHSDEDHVNGIRELLELSGKHMTALRIRRLFLPVWMKGGACAGDLEQLARAAGTTVSYIKKGDSLTSGELTVNVLHPDEEDYREETNVGSVVLSLNYKEFDALLAGDLEGKGETKVLRQIRETRQIYDYLKIAHHGSRNSTCEEFLRAADPAVSIISCSASGRYDHPHRELLDRLWAAGTDVYVTSDNGALTCTTDGRTYHIYGYRSTVIRTRSF